MSNTTDCDIRMKSEGDNDFHRIAKETILAMCSNDIDGKRVLKIEGYLSLTVESGEVFCFVIKEELDETEEQEDENSAKQNLTAEDYLQQKLDEMTAEEVKPGHDSDQSVLSRSDESESGSELLEDYGSMEAGQCLQEDVYFCTSCEKPFKTVHGLERHIRLKHSADTDICTDGFSFSDQFSDQPQAIPAAFSKWQFLDENKSKQFTHGLDPLDVHSDALEQGRDSSEVSHVNATELWEELNNEVKAEFLENVSAESEIPAFDLSFDASCSSLAYLKQEAADKAAASTFYNCPDCQKGFKTKSAFNRHLLDEHEYFGSGGEIKTQDFGVHRCRACSKQFPSSEQLFRHCRRSHRVEGRGSVGQGLFKCVYCGKVCATYGELRRHQTAHHRSRSFSCRDCDITFNSQGDQIYHRMRYHRKRTCGLCQHTCTGLVSFTEHVRSCHPGIPVYKVNKRLVCEFCSSTFGDEKHLNDHIQSKHFGLVHTCDVCGKVLGTAETLRIHRKLHEAETYRTCDVCGRQFGRLASLMEHMRSKHPENVPEKYRCSFKCLHCGLLFTRRHTLRRHTENKHEGKTYTCDVCGKIFRSRRYIVRHKKSHHAGLIVSEEFSRSKAILTDRQPKVEEEKEDNSMLFSVDGAKYEDSSLH